MKLRLVIPECENFKDWYCENSKDIDQRIEMLNQVMQESDKIGLIITSHNFLAYYPHSIINAKVFIKKKIIPALEKSIENKKPLIIGFDLLGSNEVKKRTGKKRKVKGHDSNIRFNPYDRGINAVVCYIKVENNSYVYGTHIWECWQGNECSQICIKDQYKRRVLSLGDKTIGLLSCGDIVGYCHDRGKLLPNVNIYVDLSHKSLSGRISRS